MIIIDVITYIFSAEYNKYLGVISKIVVLRCSIIRSRTVLIICWFITPEVLNRMQENLFVDVTVVMLYL